MSNSTCAALNYLTKGKKHDLVNHTGLGTCDWTKRFKPHQHVYTYKQSRVLGHLETCRRCCLLHPHVLCVFTFCTLRIATSAWRRRDSCWPEVCGLRKSKVGIDTQDTYMASVSAATEWRHSRNMVGNHNPCIARLNKLSFSVLQDWTRAKASSDRTSCTSLPSHCSSCLCRSSRTSPNTA